MVLVGIVVEELDIAAGEAGIVAKYEIAAVAFDKLA